MLPTSFLALPLIQPAMCPFLGLDLFFFYYIFTFFAPCTDCSSTIDYLSYGLQAKIGGWHSAVLLVDGTVYTFGGNSNGQLGIGLDDDKNSAPFRDLRMGAKRMRLRTVSDNSITADHSKGQRLPGPHKVLRTFAT